MIGPAILVALVLGRCVPAMSGHGLYLPTPRPCAVVLEAPVLRGGLVVGHEKTLLILQPEKVGRVNAAPGFEDL